MRILLTNNTLGARAGSEQWVEAMYNELSKNHEVDTFTVEEALPIKEYDVAIINHNTCLEALKDSKIGTKIFTSHGILPALEQPVEGADVYVSVSEEVQNHLKERGFDSIVIRNPIDTERFKEIRKVNDALQNVLFVSNYGHNGAYDTIEKACEGLNFRRIGGPNSVYDVNEYLNWADLVIGLGRSCLEALACNRNVIVYDYNGADGFVDEDSILEYRKANCSGRTNRIRYTPQRLKEEFKKYDPNIRMRDYILDNNNLTKVAEAYLLAMVK